VTGQPFVVDTRTLQEDEDKTNDPVVEKATGKLGENKAHDTLREGEKEPGEKIATDEIRAVRSAGTANFEDNMTLRLEVEGAPTPILVAPTIETVMGRRDPVTGTAPDIDLTSYAGYRMGVSRRHAVIRLRNKALDILDLGSSNGTYVNGNKLSAHQPHIIRDGDEISLGKMVLRVFFQSGSMK
jgi:predicted component of type VI protein secretion system